MSAQILLRVLVTGATLASSWLMYTSKQTVSIVGIVADASWSYDAAFKFFAYESTAACALSALAFLVATFGRKPHNPTKYFVLFIHDLLLTTLLMAGCGAATAVGWIGKYGNGHIGWTKICDQFDKFCNRVTLSVGLSYLAVVCYLLLTISSAYNSRKIEV